MPRYKPTAAPKQSENLQPVHGLHSSHVPRNETAEYHSKACAEGDSEGYVAEDGPSCNPKACT